jgi:penicillin-binding protein 2
MRLNPFSRKPKDRAVAGSMRGVKRDEEIRRTVFTRRAIMYGAVQLGLFGFLASRLYQLQVIEGNRFATLAEENRVSARLIGAPRGRITDRTGTLVAGNRLNWRAQIGRAHV